MHEMSLMYDILQMIQDDAVKHGIIKIEKIELTVGEICNAMPDALMMAFEVFKEQNQYFISDNSELIIEIEKAVAQCVVCQKRYVPDNRISFCPDCDMPSGKIISGEKLQVLSYEGRKCIEDYIADRRSDK
ncbi:hydrogenase maturation nickel metallochaperone HypA/HybF [Bacillus sp. JJ1122]|uniref:hydrogenase maturation nickel metallochaperone HypA/HybF n=1 Tax=Bacillus sp. JJ1122 TaxID=3122951 RepID=UPI002FFD730E